MLREKIICPPVKPLPDEHDEEEKVAEEAESYEEAVEHQDGGETRRIPLVDYQMMIMMDDDTPEDY